MRSSNIEATVVTTAIMKAELEEVARRNENRKQRRARESREAKARRQGAQRRASAR